MDDRVSPLSQLGRRVRAASDETATPEATVEAARRRALAGWDGRKKPARPAPRRLAITIAAAAAALLIGGRAMIPTRPALSYVVGEAGAPGQLGAWIATGTEAVPVRFSEGTVLSLASGARARVTRVDADGASVLLERGAARARVVHAGPSTRWSVQAGPFEIAVLGTDFRVAWDPGREVLDLSLLEGKVMVHGPLLGDGRALAAGERLHVDVPAAQSQIEAEPRPSAERAPAEAPAAPPVESPPAAPGEAPTATATASAGAAAHAAPSAAAHAASSGSAVTADRPGWRALAAEGRHREAMEAAEREGFDSVLSSASAPALLELADAARYAGQFPRARQALMRARAGGARGRAAFLLGKLAADHMGAVTEAITWFETYLREEPGGGFAEQALGRVVELRRRTGDAAGARRAAEEYLRRYPGGAYASLAKAAAAP